MISQTQKDFMIGALLGGTAGAAAALLFAPKMNGRGRVRHRITPHTSKKRKPSRKHVK